MKRKSYKSLYGITLAQAKHLARTTGREPRAGRQTFLYAEKIEPTIARNLWLTNKSGKLTIEAYNQKVKTDELPALETQAAEKLEKEIKWLTDYIELNTRLVMQWNEQKIHARQAQAITKEVNKAHELRRVFNRILTIYKTGHA